MKKYNVVFAMSYEIEAEDEATAIEEATNLFIDDTGIGGMGLDVFGVNVEELD